MPISIAIAAVGVGVGLIILGIKGFTRDGIAFSKNKQLVGKTGKIVGTICIVFGAVLSLIGFGFIALISAQ